MKVVIAALIATAAATGTRGTGSRCRWASEAGWDFGPEKQCEKATDCCAIVTSEDYTKQLFDLSGSKELRYTAEEASSLAVGMLEQYREDAMESVGKCVPKDKTSYTDDYQTTFTYMCYSPANLMKYKWAKRDCSK